VGGQRWHAASKSKIRSQKRAFEFRMRTISAKSFDEPLINFGRWPPLGAKHNVAIIDIGQ